jgi:hypothetical protein
MGIRRSRFFGGILVLLLLGWGIGSAELNGQFGGFIKKRANDIVKQPDKSNEATAGQSGNSAAPQFNDRVLELNEGNLAKLEKALQCEKDFRASVEAKYAKLPNEEDYGKCTMGVMMSPEVQAIMKGPTDTAQQAQAMGLKLQELTEKKCGQNPSNFTSKKNEELRTSKEQGAKCGGLTLTQYNIALERITPFCNSGGQEKVKAYGNIYYVYSPAEVGAIQPKCAKLPGLISDLK